MKKAFSLFLALTMLVSMFTFAVAANELGTIAFFNAADDIAVTQLDGVDSVYANVTFTAQKNGTASVMAAHYDIETGALTKMESIDSVSMTAGVVANFTTSAISVADTDLLKVFAWDEETIAPLANAGIIERDLLEELPTATVTAISTDADFALNFKADDVTDEQLAFYGDWEADFVFTANKDATFNVDGTKDGYLVGQYDEFGPEFVKVPASDLAIIAGTPVSIMDAAGFDVTFRDVVETVKEFNCGVDYSDAYLEANNGLEVSLALVLVNPENGNTYIVAEKSFDFTLPTATVTELDVSAINDVDLTYALNFKADPATESQLAMFSDWYADYEITINKTATFNLDGSEDGYLAGQYDSWSPAWVTVPKMDITLTPDTPLKIMETAAKSYGKPGLKYTYGEVYDRVKDFDCGIYFAPEFLAENDGLEVTLCLKMYNPANEAESYVIGDVYTYSWELPTAEVTHLDTNQLDVEADFALNFKANEATEEQLKTFGNWKADYVVTISKDATFNANGEKDGYLLGQYDEFGAEWVKLPAADLVIPANTAVNVLEAAGMKATYRDVVETVKDFDCAINFSEDFLKANDGVSATVELRIYNPANPAEYYVIGDAITRTWTLPTATVTELDVDAIENVDLTFALNFTADEATVEQLAMFGDWYADYELTVNKKATFNANGNADAYLAGQYDLWSKDWLSVPNTDATLEANTPVKVMETAAALMGQSGLKLTYKDVYNSVKNFNCGLAFTPEFLVENPDLEVTLALKMYNPNNENESYVIGRTYTFTPDTIPSIDKFVGKDVTLNHTIETIDGGKVTAALTDLFDAIGPVIMNQDVTVTVDGATVNKVASDWTKTTIDFTTPGTYTVEITDNYYCNAATATVTVVAPEAVDKFIGKTIEVTHTLDTIESGKYTVNFADLFDTNGYAVKDIAVTGGTYADGKVTVEGLGTITVTATDNFYCNVATATITVNAPANVDKFTGKDIEVTHTLDTIESGKYTVNFADLFDTNGYAVKDIAVTGGTYADGKVTVEGLGTITVTATDNFYCNAATATITVKEPANVDKFTGNTVELTHTLATIEGGVVTATLDELFTNNGYAVKEVTVGGDGTYADGVVSFAGTGTFTVTITDNFYCNEATATVVVNAPVAVDKWVGKDVTYTHTLDTIEANTVTFDFADLFTATGTFPVKDITVTGATYKDGKITVEGIGTFTITANDGFFCNTATATVIVEEPANVDKFVGKDIEVTHTLDTIESNVYTVNFADLFDTNGYAVKEIAVTGGTYADGKITVTGLGTITVTATDNFYCNEATATITVKEPVPVDKFVGHHVRYQHSFESYETKVVTFKFEELFNTLVDYPVKNITVIGGTYEDDKITVEECVGTKTVIVTDNFYCKEAVATIVFSEPHPVDKFTGKNIQVAHTLDTIESGKYTVEFTDLFDITSVYPVKDIEVTGGTYADGKVTVEGLGTITVTATDNYYCKPATATITVKEPANVDKFTGNTVTKKLVYGENTVTVTFDELFQNNGYTVKEVTVGGDGTYADGVVTFTGAGTYTVTVTDNFYCNTATATVIVEEPDIIPEEKFVKKFDKTDFMYRIGNKNEVAIEKIFVPVDGFTPVDTTVTVTPVESSLVTADITATTLKFNGTGVVKVSIVDAADPACLPTELYLEVVDATNVTGVSGTISGNMVLVNNAGTNGFTVTGDNIFYGNGFTLTNTSDGRYLGLGSGLKQGIITVKEGGTLENTVVRASIYPIAALYSDQVEDYYEVDSKDPSKIRYYYQLSAVAVSGDSTISNCHIYGARNNLYVGAGNVTVKDSVLEAGVLSNMQIESGSEYTVTLEDMTTIQYQNKPTVYANDSLKNNTMLGFGVIVGPNTSTNPNLVLKGDLKQYNWVNADDKNAVSDSYAESAINSALAVSKYQHTVNGQTSVNMGIVYLNTKTAIIDNQTGMPYALDSISVSGVSGQAYSLSGAVDTQIYSDYENADKTIATDLYKPQFKFDDDLGGQFIENVEGCDEYLYTTGKTVNILFIDGDTKVVDLAGLVNIEKYTGEDLGMTITCIDENGVAVPVSGTSVSLTDKGTYSVTYTVTDTLFYNKDGQVVADSVTYTFPITLSVSLKDNATADARFAFNTASQKMGYYKPTLGDVKQYLPFLKGLQIYDYNGQSEYLRFNGDSDFNKIAAITITGYSSNKALVEVKLTDGGVINTRFLARANSGGASTYTGSIKTKDNTVYFVNGGGTSNSASTTTSAYWYVDYYTFTGNNGVTITSAQQTFSSSGSSVSTPSGNFSTTIKATVTYDANGGSCVQTIGYATSAATSVTLPTPKRGGFLFAGWYTAPTGGNRVGGAGDSYTPSANITLYAQWGKPCDVSYDGNGGTASVTTQTYNGTALSLPTASRDGYWFLGWYTAPTGGEKIGDAGEGYHPGGAITLYAQWQEAISYTVTYNANGGSVSPASATYEGTALTLPNPTRTGYTFNGWYTAASGGTKIGNAGAEYAPSSNITLYAQWTIGNYTVKVSATNATVKINNTTVANNGSINIPYGTQVTVDVTYSQSNSRSTTIKGADGTTYNSPFSMPAQTVTVTASSSGSCFTEDTLITMGDGSVKAMKDVTKDDTILSYNFFTGCYEAKAVALLISHGVDTYEVANLTFSDGTTLRIIGDHGVFDYDANEYVYLTGDNMEAYIGHTFVKQGENGAYELVTLEKAVRTEETVGAYSLTSAGNANAFAEGLLTLAPPAGFYNWIEMGDKLRYDTEKFQKDMETYGLYTFEDFSGLVTYEQFTELNGAYLKIAVEKGIFTWDYIVELIGLYVNP